jgi:hypothetical protein
LGLQLSEQQSPLTVHAALVGRQQAPPEQMATGTQSALSVHAPPSGVCAHWWLGMHAPEQQSVGNVQ